MSFSADSTLMLEEPLLRVPYEIMRRTFKSAQKHIERDVPAVTSSLSELSDSSVDATEASEKLKGMTMKLRGLKRKLSELRQEQDKNVSNTRARIDYLQDLYKIDSIESSQFDQWSKRRLDVLLVDYFLRNGYVETADMHTQANKLAPLVDTQVLQQCMNIRQSLLNRDTAPCLAWCADNKTYLRKVRSPLDFEVRLQHYIELVKAGRKTEAVQYHRKHLTKSADTQLHTIQQASALLAFPPDTDVATYRELYSDARWTTLADLFVSTFYNLHGLPSQSSLIESLAAGISALKTYSCLHQPLHAPVEEDGQHHDDHDEVMHDSGHDWDSHSNGLNGHSASSANGTQGTNGHSMNGNGANRFVRPKLDLSRAHMCPICSQELNELAKPLPFALHVHSHLDADPIVLPNGRIYGMEKLLDYSAKAGLMKGKVADPTTKEVFDASEMKHVYPS
uniref:ARAD1D43362p n=1 Tax=Blastobotrys adeninivorans TaxID=409370 RepID=A0A060TCK8_BLAAD